MLRQRILYRKKPVTLGAMHDNGSSYYYRYWKGIIYKVRIYLKALTNSQIQDLINKAMS